MLNAEIILMLLERVMIRCLKPDESIAECKSTCYKIRVAKFKQHSV
jgi:hypothetical protein